MSKNHFKTATDHQKFPFRKPAFTTAILLVRRVGLGKTGANRDVGFEPRDTFRLGSTLLSIDTIRSSPSQITPVDRFKSRF